MAKARVRRVLPSRVESVVMAQRPRQHELEGESRRAFECAIPTAWVARPVTPDYGVDLSVEVFKDGVSTGLEFYVQLKATDEPDIDKALGSLRISRDHADYYWGLALPVLMVRYHSPSGQLYARWWHGYNPKVAVRPDEVDPQAEPARSLKFVFRPEDEWDAAITEQLIEGVVAFRRFRSADPGFPIGFAVSAGDDVDAEEVTRQLLSLQVLLRPVSSVVVVRRGPAGSGDPSITIGSEATRVSLADVTSVTMDSAGAAAKSEEMAANIGCAIAMVLDRVGQANAAAQVAAACVARSTVISGPYMAWTLAGAFFRSQRTLEVLDVIDQLNERGDEDARSAAAVFHTAVLARGDQMTPAERARAVEVAGAALERVKGDCDPHYSAVYAYNLGRAHAIARNWPAAAEAFVHAAGLDASYEHQPYFLRDLACCLFESGRAEEAAEVARKALALEPYRSTEALLADSLMFAGRYAEAHETFSNYLDHAPSRGPADAPWRLKLRVLDVVRGLVGDSQNRRPDGADETLERIELLDAGATGEEVGAYVQAALDEDALAAGAHHYRALLSMKEEEGAAVDASGALEPAVCAAVLAPSEAGLWTFAIRIASAYGAPDLTYDLMHEALFLNDGDVVAGLLADTPLPLSSEGLALLEQAKQDVVDRRQSGFVVRVRNTDGSVDELTFDADDENAGDPSLPVPNDE